ncbi:Hpt domain-containing protein [Wenxinia marina]|uniref:Hpt domain protein n=1 Tax=Wenxinia marina DSM 24838 TaxID=1123501 RepID=A0A0D0QA46_9RHOB|nr:Hpt domain-containing protein [Wenxinia marina]KIQ69182.1 Hpt domain protein [Wenxinia marina DSM 24838]GGL70995.1 hypothetical protein GCM10011392_26920 [Wenxinia marina]
MSSNATTAIDTLSDSLSSIRVRFMSDLELREQELRSLATGEICDVAREDRHHQARRIAHRLAGVSGTLGFPALGNLAADVDDAIGRALAVPGDAGRTAAADGAVARLAEAIGSVVRSGRDIHGL